jgi:O-antigen ligase
VQLASPVERLAPVAGILLLALAASAALGMLAALSGEAALLFGGVLLLALSVLLRHRFGIWLMCLLMPISQTVLVPRQILGITGMNPVNVLFFATLGSLLLAWAYTRFARFQHFDLPPLPRPLLWLYLLPMALAALHGSFSVDRIPVYFHQIGAIAFDNVGGYLRDAFVRPLFLVAFCLLVAHAYRQPQTAHRYFAGALLAGLVLCGLEAFVLASSGLSLNLLGSPRARGVLSALGMHANEISLMLNSALALALFSVRGATGTARGLLIACSALFATCVLLTFSRGGFLGLLVVFAAFLFHANSPRSAIVALLMAGLFVGLVPDAVVERASTGVAAGDRGAISAGRADSIWPHLVPVILDQPLVGGGLMSILWSPPARSGVISVAQTHNAYLGLLMDMGLLGFICVMAFFIWAWRQMRSACREATDDFHRHFFAGASVTVPLLFAQGVSDDRFTPTTTQSYLWFALGAALGYRAYLRQRSPATDARP